jgi:hypothetical protein
MFVACALASPGGRVTKYQRHAENAKCGEGKRSLLASAFILRNVPAKKHVTHALEKQGDK